MVGSNGPAKSQPPIAELPPVAEPEVTDTTGAEVVDADSGDAEDEDAFAVAGDTEGEDSAGAGALEETTAAGEALDD